MTESFEQSKAQFLRLQQSRIGKSVGDIEKVSPSGHREIEGQIHQTGSYSNFNARQRPSLTSGNVADLLTGIPTYHLLNIVTQFGTSTGKSNVNIQRGCCTQTSTRSKDTTKMSMKPTSFEDTCHTRRSTPVRDETRHTDTRQEIHRRRWRISPSAGIHFSDATGEEQLFEKQTMSWEFRHPTARLNRRPKPMSSCRNLAHLFLSNWWMTHRRFYLQKDWSTRRDIRTRGNLDRVRFLDEGDASRNAVSTMFIFLVAVENVESNSPQCLNHRVWTNANASSNRFNNPS